MCNTRENKSVNTNKSESEINKVNNNWRIQTNYEYVLNAKIVKLMK